MPGLSSLHRYEEQNADHEDDGQDFIKDKFIKGDFYKFQSKLKSWVLMEAGIRGQQEGNRLPC